MADKYKKGTGSGRGGWHGGGRPKGSKTDKTERINRAVTADEKIKIIEYLNTLRGKNT